MGLADAAARYTRDVLNQIDNFDLLLQHLALATGRNIAVGELVWGRYNDDLTLTDVVPVDFTRLIFDDLDRLRILTDTEPYDGIEPPPHKFVVHTPHCTSGHAARGGILRVTALTYLAKNLALKDWMIFAEIVGMPVRIARYEPSATADEKREMLNMLESLGSNAAGIFSRAVDLQIVEANRGAKGPPYEKLIEFLNREMSKAWLGQTLTTDVAGASSSYAASRVHEQVRRDVLADDLRKEARTIRRDILAPIARFKFGPGVPVPLFQRKLDRFRTPAELADLLDVAVNNLGLRVPEDWVRQSLDIPAAGDDAPTLGGRGSFTEPRP